MKVIFAAICAVSFFLVSTPSSAFVPPVNDPGFWHGKKKLKNHKRHWKAKKKKRLSRYYRTKKTHRRASYRIFTPIPVQQEVFLPDIMEGFKQFLTGLAFPGTTMKLQGLDTSIGNLHPAFQQRLTKTLQMAKLEGIEAHPFSAFRQPGLGIGGFKNKFLSCHSYGLAVDVFGIGKPGSKTAKRFHQIAALNGVYGVYGPSHRSEFNHFQATSQRACGAVPELRRTITASGPSDKDKMWAVGTKLIEGKAYAYRVKHKRHRHAKLSRKHKSG